MRRTLLLAAVALFVLQVAMSLARTGPVLMADEAGYLGNARMLSGGLEFEMGTSPFYRAGYSVLIAPVVGLGTDPATTYNIVLVVNAALAASLVLLLYLLLTRCFQVPPVWAVGGAIAGATYPTVTSLSQIAMSENALFALTVVWLLSVGWLLSTHGRLAVLSGLVTGACAAALWVVHGRMIVVVALTALLLVGLAARRRISVAAGLAGVGGLAIGLAGGKILNDLVIKRTYDGRDVDEVGETLGALDDLDAVLAVVRNVIGESWYLLVATFGVIAFLVFVEGRAMLTKRRQDDPGVATVTLALLLTAVAGLIVVTAVWFVDATRPDQIAYGRYVEPMIPPLLALGVVALARQSSIRASRIMVAGIAGFSVVVAALTSGLDFPGADANRWNLASLPFVTRDLGPVVVVGAGVVAAGGAWAIATIARRAPWATWLAVLALFVPITVFNEVRLVLQSEHDAYPAGWTSPQATVEARTDAVAYDTSHLDPLAVKVYQWFLPNTRFELFDAGAAPPPAPVFFSTSGWSREHRDLPATILWRDPGRDQVLWRLRGPG